MQLRRSSRQHSTVYDAANLRIHPDDSPVGTSSKNASTETLDPHGNLFATDALAPRRRKRSRVSTSAQHDAEVVETGEADSPAIPPSKRLRTEEPNLNLNSDPHFNSSTTDPSSTSYFHEPSLDLINMINYTAARHWHNHNQLHGSAASYRKHRAAKRRLNTLLSKKRPRDDDDENGENDDAEDDKKDDDEGDSVFDQHDREGTEGLAEEVNENEEDAEYRPPTKTKRKKRLKAEPLVDMYMSMDGSAMRALGMVVQEQIAFLLTPSPSAPNPDDNQFDGILPRQKRKNRKRALYTSPSKLFVKKKRRKRKTEEEDQIEDDENDDEVDELVSSDAGEGLVGGVNQDGEISDDDKDDEMDALED